MLKKVIIVAGGNKDGLEHMLIKEDKETLVIGVDGGALYLLYRGIIPDIGIGDFDSVSPDDLIRLE